MSKRYMIQVLTETATEAKWENVQYGNAGDWMCRRYSTALDYAVKLRKQGEARELAIVESKPVYATKTVDSFPAATDEDMKVFTSLPGGINWKGADFDSMPDPEVDLVHVDSAADHCAGCGTSNDEADLITTDGMNFYCTECGQNEPGGN